jgi:hypothetical protein
MYPFNGFLGKRTEVPGIEQGSLLGLQVNACGSGDMACRIQGHKHLVKYRKADPEVQRTDTAQHGGNGVVGNLPLSPIHEL